MGLDVGTTGVKAAVFDLSGAMRGYGFEEYEVVCAKPGWAEQDAEHVFQAACRVMGAAAAEAGGEIAAIGLSVQGDAVIAVDEAYRPVAPVQLGMDYRCLPESEAFAREFGEEWLFKKTGMRPHPLNSLCKVRNFVFQTPEVDRRAARYMTYSDYMLSRLGADEPVIDQPMATAPWRGPSDARLGRRADQGRGRGPVPAFEAHAVRRFSRQAQRSIG
jgi:xylulokinase